jgi:hypothetical protein
MYHGKENKMSHEPFYNGQEVLFSMNQYKKLNIPEEEFKYVIIVDDKSPNYELKVLGLRLTNDIGVFWTTRNFIKPYKE